MGWVPVGGSDSTFFSDVAEELTGKDTRSGTRSGRKVVSLVMLQVLLGNGLQASHLLFIIVHLWEYRQVHQMNRNCFQDFLAKRP